MGNHYTPVDVSTWKRAVHCSIFRDYVEPCFSVSTELDITNFREKLRARGLPFTFPMIFAVAKCANEIEEFRYRFVDGEIVLFDRIDTSFSYMNTETELFKVVTVPLKETMEEYVVAAATTAEEQKEYFTGPMGNDVFIFSPIPWISFTHISHTNSGRKDQATPMIDWGKYFKRDGRLLLPFSVQAHHSFVDGLHVGKLVIAVQEYLNAF
ncbi:MAG: chloramphenicol acetyltransferase [Clostridiaceae bacterium]|jgi:chloramphenicol O-acetyltransferase type B|nr:chloramphenicol acetyltransferase [Oscillospiraceae bacterium]NLO62846.1 chloramphenicol acetyltransferase [Clostridiaceae bacterium]